MIRRWLACLLATATLVGLAACAETPDALVVAGTVEDTVATVAAPLLSVPAVVLDSESSQTAQGGESSTAASTYGLGSYVRIAEVLVVEGSAVEVGAVVARADTAPLKAQREVAKADAARSAAQVDVIAAAIENTYDREATLKDKRRDVVDAIDELTDTRAKLVRTRAQLKQKRPQLIAQRKTLRAGRDQLRPQLHTAREQLAALEAQVPTQPELQPQVDQLKAGIATMTATLDQLNAGISQLTKGLAQLDAGLKQISTALPKLDKGLKKARAGLEKLKDAQAKLEDARAQLRDLKELAEIAADAGGIPVLLAELQFSLAELTSPVSGVVVSVAGVGDELAPGASVATIRESAPSVVTAWVSPTQVASVCLGDGAQVLGDWMSAPVSASLTAIGDRAEYPPTSVPTDEVHLTRAVEVQFTATEQLPAGLPVEITIDNCRPFGGPTDADR